MIKLIIAFVVAGLIALGVVMYNQFSEDSDTAEQAGQQFQNTTEIIEGANDAVQQTQDLQNDINDKAQQQLQNQGY